MKKLILVKNSDGQRGANGKKKIYEIVVVDNRVITSWGKAEELQKQQTQTKVFASSQQALWFAFDKQMAKEAKGYELVASL
jgi:predicted DNA-binding WGR domain protein